MLQVCVSGRHSVYRSKQRVSESSMTQKQYLLIRFPQSQDGICVGVGLAAAAWSNVRTGPKSSGTRNSCGKIRSMDRIMWNV